MNEFTILCVIAFVILVIKLFFDIKGDNQSGILTIFALIILATLALLSWTTPTAEDVYTGKTTLQYIIVDGQVVDSVIIFKIQ